MKEKKEKKIDWKSRRRVLRVCIKCNGQMYMRDGKLHCFKCKAEVEWDGDDDGESEVPQ